MNNFLESLVILVVGISGVLISLSFFFVVIILLKKTDETFNRFRVRKHLKIDKSTDEQREPDPQIVAVISAAVFETFHQPVRIKKIHFIDSPKQSPWSASGKTDLLKSHLIKMR